MREVLDAANELDSWRTRDIAEHPDVTITERQVRTHLNDLADRGYVSWRFEGRGYVWEDDGLHEVSDHGDVDLDVVEDETTVAEVSRMSTYTWNFRNTEDEPASDADGGGGVPQPLFSDGGVDDISDDPPPG